MPWSGDDQWTLKNENWKIFFARRSRIVMSTYLVTGVAGFIASKVAEQLLAAGHTVVGVDNLNDYYDVRLKDYRLSKLLGAKSKGLGEDPKVSVYAVSGLRSQVSLSAIGPATAEGLFEFRVLDIENLPALEEVFKAHKFDAVFNLAARAGVRASLENPELYRRTNVLGEEHVLKCQVKYGVKKHVLASSSSVYAGCPMPFTEEAALGQMQSPYAETKRAAEELAREYHDKHGLDVSALRYFTVFGPAGRPDMAPLRFIKWIDEGTPITLYGDGTQARDFTYVDDIARGTILAAKPLGYEVINLGGGNNPVSMLTVIRWIEKALEASAQSAKSKAESARSGSSPLPLSPSPVKAVINRLPASPADMAATWADITKAGRLLGWKPQVTPKAGFQRAVEWHVANRAWLKDVTT
jgi:nucleoside-diphosphate-sugar epimerase